MQKTEWENGDKTTKKRWENGGFQCYWDRVCGGGGGGGWHKASVSDCLEGGTGGGGGILGDGRTENGGKSGEIFPPFFLFSHFSMGTLSGSLLPAVPGISGPCCAACHTAFVFPGEGGGGGKETVV